jgi:hypothetical protein
MLNILSFVLLLLNNLLPPQMVWQTAKIHDFGEISRSNVEDEALEFTFVFKNNGDTPLVLDNVRTECGCTASEWERQPLEKGQEGKVKVAYSTKKTGYFQQKITVWVRGQRKPERLEIRGEILEN